MTCKFMKATGKSFMEKHKERRKKYSVIEKVESVEDRLESSPSGNTKSSVPLTPGLNAAQEFTTKVGSTVETMRTSQQP